MKSELLDLTKILDGNLSIYREGDYTDPPFRLETWCTVPGQGYRVGRLELGTQTGTHIDAPAHFQPDGAELEALPVEALVGRYLWIDLDHFNAREEPAWQGEPVLFLASARQEVELSEAAFQALLALPCRTWVIVSEVRITGSDPFHFNRELGRAGKYLVEDLEPGAARRVRPGGEIFALPLRLAGASGSPCRVFVRQALPG